MANGQYRIVEAQYPLVFGLAGHNFLVLLDPNGEVIGELHGLATSPKGEIKSIGYLPEDRLQSHWFDHRTKLNDPDGVQAELASGDRATIMNLWNAAKAAGDRMNEADIQYPWLGLGKNSNSFASTLIGAMGLTEPPMPGGAPIMPGARSMLLEPEAIQDIQRRFNISALRSDDTPNTGRQPDGLDQPSPLDTARWPFGPVGAPSSRATAPQILDPNSTMTPRRDLPGTVVPGAQGPTSLGGPNGPRPLLPPASLRSPAPASPTAPAADPTLPPLHFAPEAPQRFGPFEVPGLFRSDVFSGPRVAPADGMGTDSSIPPMPTFGAPSAYASPAASGIARPLGEGNPVSDRWNDLVDTANAISQRSLAGGLSPSMPDSVAAPPTQAALGGLPGMMARAGMFDPPAGGLLGMLQEYMRNNPDDGAAR